MTTAADLKNYPAPRKRGTDTAVEAPPTSFQAPRMRVFPFFFTFAASSRRAFSTPLLAGPAIIKGIELYPTLVSSPPSLTVEVGTSRIEVLENSVALSTPRPYTVLTELLDPFAGMNPAAGDGYPLHTVPTLTAKYESALDLIITDREFCAVLAMVNNNVGAAEVSGVLRVLEAVDPEALRFFV